MTLRSLHLLSHSASTRPACQQVSRSSRRGGCLPSARVRPCVQRKKRSIGRSLSRVGEANNTAAVSKYLMYSPISYRYAAPSHLGGTRTWQLRRARRRLSQGCHRHLSSTLASTAMDCGTGRSRATTERAREMENNTDTPVPRVSAPRHLSCRMGGLELQRKHSIHAGALNLPDNFSGSGD